MASSTTSSEGDSTKRAQALSSACGALRVRLLKLLIVIDGDVLQQRKQVDNELE